MKESPADLVVQKLRTLIREKADLEASGSPEHERLQEMLELSDDALLDTLFHAVEPNTDRVGCPPRETLRELAMRQRSLSDPLWDHVMECAPCRTAVRQLGRDRRSRSPFRAIPAELTSATVDSERCFFNGDHGIGRSCSRATQALMTCRLMKSRKRYESIAIVQPARWPAIAKLLLAALRQSGRVAASPVFAARTVQIRARADTLPPARAL